MAFDPTPPTKSAALTVGNNFAPFQVSAGGLALITQLNPREVMTAQFNIAGVGTPTDAIEVELLQGHREIANADLDGAASGSSLDLDTINDGFATADEYDGTFIHMTNGDEAGEMEMIITGAQATDTVTLENAFSGTPSAGETYDRYRWKPYRWVIPVATTLTADATNTDDLVIHAAAGEWVAFRARRDGTTDAHIIWVTLIRDNVSA